MFLLRFCVQLTKSISNEIQCAVPHTAPLLLGSNLFMFAKGNVSRSGYNPDFINLFTFIKV